ncbi:hypothetical protein BJV74DRAFT_825301 [Russula compacta]|nr:hypothetical protein BJV74DRAFT_825301 [Russula compacta]
MHGLDNMPREASGSHTRAQTDVEQFVPDLSDNAVDGSQKHHSTHLRVKVTGCFLFNTSVILGFGVAKAVYSYRGQAIVSTTLDWVSGTALAIVLYWLSTLEARCPEMWPLFFEVDYAPPILKFICRPEVRALPFTFLSIIPVGMAAKRVRAVLDVRPYVKAGLPNFADGIFIMAMAGLLMAIFSFLQQVRRAVVPHRFDVLDNLLRVMGILLIIILSRPPEAHPICALRVHGREFWIPLHYIRGPLSYNVDSRRTSSPSSLLFRGISIVSIWCRTVVDAGIVVFNVEPQPI